MYSISVLASLTCTVRFCNFWSQEVACEIARRMMGNGHSMRTNTNKKLVSEHKRLAPLQSWLSARRKYTSVTFMATHPIQKCIAMYFGIHSEWLMAQLRSWYYILHYMSIGIPREWMDISSGLYDWTYPIRNIFVLQLFEISTISYHDHFQHHFFGKKINWAFYANTTAIN